MSQKLKQSFKGRQCGRAPDGWLVYAGGKAVIQRVGKGEAFAVKSCHDLQQRKNASQEGPVEIIFFHKPFTRLFGFFVHLFPVEETQQCLCARETVASRREESSGLLVVGLEIQIQAVKGLQFSLVTLILSSGENCMGVSGTQPAQSLISLNFWRFFASNITNCSSEHPASRRVLQILCNVAEQYHWREKENRRATEVLSSKIMQFYNVFQR